jgi:hypothetical protein
VKNKTITVDLEAWSPTLLCNTTGGIHTGQMLIYAAGRQTGKSMCMEMLKNRIYDTNLCKEILLPMYQKSKYQFSRAKWYVVDFWDMSALPDTTLKPKVDWCKEHFGPHPVNPDAWSRWYIFHDKIKFRDEADAALFLLRWA